MPINWHARSSAIIESHELVDQDLSRANASKTALEDIRCALRGSMNRPSRPFLRKLTLLDLLDEILLGIFGHLEYNSLVHFSRPEIKALRLVCKRISDIASHLLMRVVHLNLHEESSLKRLEEVSCHPIIAKGVHAVNIRLMFYNQSFTEMENLLEHYAFEIADTVDMYERCRMWEFGSGKTSEEEAAQLLADGQDVVATLYHLLAPGERAEDLEHHALQVSETHRLYLELLQRQNLFLQGDNLYQAFGSAMARMPHARSLAFDDADMSFWAGNTQHIMTPGVDMWESLCSQMLAPLSGYHVEKHLLDSPSLRCVPRLIDAVRDAGVLLHHLDIKLLRHEDSRADRDDLDGGNGEYLTGLIGFLSACLDTSSLQSVDLDMRGDGRFTLRLKDVFNQKRSLDKLTDVFLGNWDVNYTDLAVFLRRLPTRMESFSMYNVNLLTGSWRDVLDAVREKKCGYALLKDPQGAEREGMAEEGYRRIFEDEVGHMSLAERYMSSRGSWLKNPILDQEYTLSDEEDSDEEDDTMDEE
ncbi:hypothetical protein B0T14DRAFT_546841 [Immersiella caudata]|uniref:F-box domain-containing protein n=1 Tax=Immersiella caudata TaxID=314043 RepID=A0AA39WJP8_9PEZI|nr:hypothetical protein B0T14DRAFT_546841 [Immersiella caudata]